MSEKVAYFNPIFQPIQSVMLSDGICVISGAKQGSTEHVVIMSLDGYFCHPPHFQQIWEADD